MKKLPLLIAAIFMVCATYAQTVLNPVPDLLKLMAIQNAGKASIYLTTKHCRFVGKNPHEGGFDFMYRLPRSTNSFGLTVLDNTGSDVAGAFYVTFSLDEYQAALNYVKAEGYLLQGDGSTPNFLAYAKGDNLVMLGISAAGDKSCYTISAKKVSVY